MTVSRYLNNPKLVSESARVAINNAVSATGYVRNGIAGGLSSSRSGFVGVVVPTLINSNFADTVVGIDETLRSKGFQILLAHTMYSSEQEEGGIRQLLERRPEALVLVGNNHSDGAERMLDQAKIPVIELWESSGSRPYHTVGFSNFDAGFAAAQYLVGLGHTRVGAIGPGQNTASDARDFRAEDRMAGFEAGLRSAGLSIDRLVRRGDIPFSFERGAEAARFVLDTYPDTQAIFAVSDLPAVGAIMQLRRMGRAVPDDISVIGFGDFEVGRVCEPTLTTVRVDARMIGVHGGRLVLAALDGTLTEKEVVDVELGIVARSSTRAI